MLLPMAAASRKQNEVRSRVGRLDLNLPLIKFFAFGFFTLGQSRYMREFISCLKRGAKNSTNFRTLGRCAACGLIASQLGMSSTLGGGNARTTPSIGSPKMDGSGLIGRAVHVPPSTSSWADLDLYSLDRTMRSTTFR